MPALIDASLSASLLKRGLVVSALLCHACATELGQDMLPSARLLLQAPSSRGVLPPLSADPLPCHPASRPKVCLINSTITSPRSLEISNFEGDVEIVGRNVSIVSTEGYIQISATGKVSLQNAAGIAAHENLILSGSQLEIGTTLKSGGHVALGVEMVDDKCDSIDISGTTVTGASLTMRCQEGTVDVKGTTLTVVQEAHLGNGIIIEASNINMDADTKVQANGLTVEAANDAKIIAGHLGGLPGNGSTTVLNSFRAFARGHMDLGSQNAHWTVRKFTAAAQNVVIKAGHTIEALDTSCQNQKSMITDRCNRALQAWPPDEPVTAAGAHADKIAHAASDPDVSFDFVAVASEDLRIEDGARAYGSAMFLCAGGDGIIGELATMDASWRGCSAEEGAGRGATNTSKGANCGAGGASNLGRGGHGVLYGALSATACANPGLQYDMRHHPGYLPTQTASGGGCGVTTTPCDKELGGYSHGGGLIWIHVQHQLSIEKGTKILADGNRGKQIAETENSSSTVSGGGAGGQVFLYAATLTVKKDSPITVSAQGGSVMCSNSVAGGAGGGGFVGLGLLGDRKASVTDGLNVNVDSGGFGDACSNFNFPESGERLVFGTSGLAASLAACDAGHAGIFCLECPLGRWNAEGGNLCHACDNKPESNSEYTKTAVTTPVCPYRCVAGVPEVGSNPECLDVLPYIFEFFGGTTGVLVILGLLVVVIALLLWRRARFGIRSGQTVKTADSFSRVRSCMLCELLRYLQEVLAVFSSHASPDGLLWFSKEQLPYHVCRIWMCGNNSFQNPWGFDEVVPIGLEDLVVSDRWAQFAREANRLAKIKRCELWVQRLLKVIYPPAAPVYAARRRRKRAAKLRKCTNAYSEGSGSHLAIWKPIRARGNAGNGALAMAFGFDSGATLGYVDFLDFSRSQLDWAPVDLKNEVRFIVAHGDGSYVEPFSLDASDPLLQHLGHMGLGEAAVYGVVSVFNANARFLRSDALQEGSASPVLMSLRKAVDQCAERCGLDGLVHVLVVPQQNMKYWHLASSPEASPELRPTATPDTRSVGTYPMRAIGTGHSFSDLIPSHRLSRQPSPHFGISELRQPSYSSGPTARQVRSKIQWRLCLAFTDRNANFHDISYSQGGLAASVCGVRGGGMTSPMACANLSDQLAWSLEQAADAHRLGARKLPRWYSCAQRLGSRLLASRISARSGRKLATPATLILLVFVSLMFTDFLLFLLMWSLLESMQGAFLWVWLLVPPFTQPLAFVMGPLTLLLELPRLGRLFALMVAFGFLNAGITMLLLLISQVDSWAFHVLGCVSICVVKAVLILCANAHIRGLEAALDLSFINTHQADTVCVLISGEPSSPDLVGPSSGDRRPSRGPRRSRLLSEDGRQMLRQTTNSTSCSTHSAQLLEFDHNILPTNGTFSLPLSRQSTPPRSATPERFETAMGELRRKNSIQQELNQPSPF